jgi:hypothetical protein
MKFYDHDFWLRVQRDYQPETNEDRSEYICDNSREFGKEWENERFRFLCDKKMKELFEGETFVNDKYNNLLLCYFATSQSINGHTRISVRRDFIQEMINATKP